MTRTGIVIALRAEAHCLIHNKLVPGEPINIGEQLLLVLSGMGSDNVNKAINALLAQKVEGLVSFGTAGALRDDIKSGDILIPENIIDANGHCQNISSSWRDNAIQQLTLCPATVHVADITTTKNVIANAEDKQVLHEKTAAIGVDMESALVAKAARDHKLSVLVIRIVVDEANMTIPTRILQSTDAYGHVAIPALLGGIIMQPGLIWELLKLGSAFKAASHSMNWIGRHAEQVFLPN